MFQKIKKAIKQFVKRTLLARGGTSELIVELMWADRQYCIKHPYRVCNYARTLNKALTAEGCNVDVPIPSGMMGLRAGSERSKQLLLREGQPRDRADLTSTGEIKKGNRRQRALLISHEMSLTGAPLMLLNTAIALKRAGYHVSVWSPSDGEAVAHFEEKGFPVNIITVADLSKTLVSMNLSSYDIAICNTILCDEFVYYLDGKLPLLWYLHEADTIDSLISDNKRRELTLRQSESLVVVSDYARNIVKAFNSSPICVLQNAIPDISHLSRLKKSNRRTRLNFMAMGTIIPTKGFDLLCNAYISMPDAYRRRSKLQIVGHFIKGFDQYAEEIIKTISQNDGIEYLGFFSTDKEKAAIFDQADVFVLPSRGDACPLVVLEAAMFSKPMVVSDHVGSKYLVDNQNGIIFKSENVDALRDALMKMIDMQDHLNDMGKRSREAYEKKATMKAYENQLIQLVEAKINDFEAIRNT